MKNLKQKFILVCILLSNFSLYAQTNDGINYKAIIKDENANVVANQEIQVEFMIMEGQGLDLIYHEEYTITTNSNGLIVLIIGEGSFIDGEVEDIVDIDWSDGVYFYKVLIDIGNGLVDMGTDLFKSVPYAMQAEKAENVFSGNYNDLTNQPSIVLPTGLEAIDEGNGLGWRLKGQDSDNYGNIGFNAVDLSYNDINSDTHGAIGQFATAMGNETIASGYSSTALGNGSVASGSNSIAMGNHTIASEDEATAIGDSTEASGENSIAIGTNSKASGEASIAMGNFTNSLGLASTTLGWASEASGNFSTSIGHFTKAPSYAETVIGNHNTDYTPISVNFWNANDRLFVIGNGTDVSKSNALTILKNGEMTVNANSASGGIKVTNSYPDGTGILIENTPNGIHINDLVGDGIEINDVSGYGIKIANSNAMGVFVDNALNNGGFFDGFNGVYARARDGFDVNPDIILGGNNNTASGDDGIISSDPFFAGSDIFLRSNDAVVVQLDFDDDETGQFEIKAGDGTEIFEVDESGTIRQNGSTIHSSDRRLKKNIEDLNYGLDEILQLQPKAYHWKNNAQKYKSLGLIAQEVQPLIKEIVTAQDNEEKTLGISYTELIPILIKAIQEQQTIINNQGAEINDLKTDLSQFESLDIRLKELESLLKISIE